MRQLANLRHSLGERLLQPLDVLEDLGFFAVAEHRLDLVALLARELADLRDDDRDHRQLGIDVQRRQILRRECLAHVGHRGQAQVGLVDAVQADRLVVAHAAETAFADPTPMVFERRGQKSFDDVEHHLRTREADLQIDLRELGLAVGAQVFVAEAAHDLEVLVEARDHQDLLEHLRRLRQRVKLAGMHAAGHQIIARALGRGARHERRLDFVEALRVQVFADGDRHLVPQLDVVLHLRPAQIEVAILQAHFFVGQYGVGGREGQRLAIVQQAKLVGDDLDLAGGMFLLMVPASRSFTWPMTATTNSERKRLGLLMHVGAGVSGDDHLRDAAAVAQVEEDEVAEIAPAVDPAHENNFRTGVGGAQLATHMSTF